jgi:hypothetical protein
MFFYAIVRAQEQLNLPMGTCNEEVLSKAYEYLKLNQATSGVERLPSRPSVLESLWEKFSRTGSVVRKPSEKGGRKQNQGARDLIMFLVESGECKSIRDIERKMAEALPACLRVGKTTIYKILKENKMFFYKAPKGQKLTARHVEDRYVFARDMHNRIKFKRIDINNIIWTDECIIKSGHHPNSKNDGFWRYKGQFDDWQSHLIPRQAHPPSVHVFVALHSKIGVIGPYNIADIECPTDPRGTLTSTKYVYFLENILFPEISRRLAAHGLTLEDCWFQQHGAAPHCANEALEYLIHKFGTRLISRRTSTI